MTNQQTENSNAQAAPNRPQFRVWLVTDKDDGKAEWNELSGLWPNRSGRGYHGKTLKLAVPLSGRVVVLPASFDLPKEG